MQRRIGYGKLLTLALAPISFMALAAASPAVAGDNYALIVAASKYANLADKYWLKGPVNDAVLVRDYLINNAPVPFAPENVTTLGTGPGLTDPTRAAILGELNRIATTVKRGDFVFLQFSGHGSFQPAIDDTTEPDGRDEVFLPADVRMAPSGSLAMPNAITDNEIGDVLTAMRKAGAFVWIVFDSCYSGTMTRAAPVAGDDPADRKIDPGDLGIPDSAFSVPDETPDSAARVVPLDPALFEASAGDAPEGGLVAFFAAQSTEPAQEKNFSIAQADGSNVATKYGVFTYTLFSALAQNPNMTYRQLAQSVLQMYASKNALKPTPLFEGKLDAPVFGSTDAANAAQWQTAATADGALTIAAGQLHGLSEGTQLLVLPNPAASDDEAIGLVKVASTETLRSILVPAEDATHPAIAAADVPKGAYARLAKLSYSFELTIARPDASAGDAAEIEVVNNALDATLSDAEKPLKLRVVDAGQPADVRLALLSEQKAARLAGAITPTAATDETPRLWLLPSSGEISLVAETRSPSMTLEPDADSAEFSQQLAENLVTIYRATGLAKLATANSFRPKDFTLEFGLQKAGAKMVTPLAPEDTPIVQSGDWLYLDFDNQSGKPVDLNVLYLDHDYGITLICRAHLPERNRIFEPIAQLNDTDRGSERMIAVINESGKDMTDLSFLEQRGIRTATRGAGDVSLAGLIADLGAGEDTRGPTPAATSGAKSPRGAVVMVPLEVRAATAGIDASTSGPAVLDDTRKLTRSCELSSSGG